MRKLLFAGIAGLAVAGAAAPAFAQSIPVVLSSPPTCAVSGNWYFASGTNRLTGASPSGGTHSMNLGGGSFFAPTTGLPVFTGPLASTTSVTPSLISGSAATRYRGKAMCNNAHTMAVEVTPVLGPGGTPPAGFNNRFGLQAEVRWTATTGLTGMFPTQTGPGVPQAGTTALLRNAWSAAATGAAAQPPVDAYLDIRVVPFIPSALANGVYPGENPQLRRLVAGTYSGSVTVTLTP